jgi:hypothetical protein
MSYLHPAYFRLLPGTARPQLIALLQLVERNCRVSRDGWCDMRQAALARELARSVRNVQRYEAVCEGVGVLVVELHRRGNRRRLRLRSAKEAAALHLKPSQTPLREWRHACRNSGDTRVVTVNNSHLLPRARVLFEETSSESQTRKPAPPAEGASPARRETPTRRAVAVPESVVKATNDLAAPLGARWAPKVAQLVLELVAAQGARQTLGFLGIVRQRTDGQVQPYARAKATLAMLSARLRKLGEGGEGRSGRPGNPARARFSA